MKIQHFLALVVLSLATVPGARAAVVAGPITNAANAHTYYLLSHNNWPLSEAEARGLGGHLVTINDAAENQWVVTTFFPLIGFAEARIWIGLNDAANEGQFVWASGEPVTFTYWSPGQPDNGDFGGADYAAIWHSIFAPSDGRWNDISDPLATPIPTALAYGVVEVPVAVTQPADQFMPGSARLNGLANPKGSPTLAWFEWGTSLAYGNATPPQSVGSGSNAAGFSNVIVGLVSGPDYHFRARASNAFGSFAGVDRTFNLGNQLPLVTTLAADQLTTTSVLLSGQVNPRSWPTAAWFEWGTNTNYGNLIGMQEVGQGSSVSNLNVVLNGLMIASNYHYRVVASNAFGAVYGADQTFNMRQRAAVLAGPLANVANGHAYYLLSADTWTASEAEARGLGGHLVTINDAAENQWVLNTFFPLTGVPYASLWTGLNDAANEGQFVWASGEPVTFTYWYPGEPNNLGGEDYATIRHPSEVPPTGSWNDLSDTSGQGNTNAPIFGVVELPTPLPVAATQRADQFMPGSARLNGLANPNGSPALAWFEWGTSLAYGNATPQQSVGSGSNAVGFSNVIVGLVIGPVYHFRARASNAFGSFAGLNQTFNLNSQGPVVTTLAADQLTNTSARLRGQVNPRSSPTAAWFEWGTDTNYGNVIGMQDVGQGSSVSNLSVVLDGLMGGPNYHYRLVATNAFGAVYGADQTFGLGFVPIPIPGLPGVYVSSMAWGDYDNDGRLDFLLMGYAGGYVTQLWRNTGSGFSNVTASVAPGLPGVYDGSVAWGDYDNDGRLDFLLTGSGISQLWRNTGSGFSNVTASVAPGLPGVSGSSVAWGDYDNDGRLDFLLTGIAAGPPPVSQVWRNTGSGFSNVTASVAPGLTGVYYSSVAWGDYDNDGWLDFLLTGYTGGPQVSQVWRNTGSGFSNVTTSVAPGLPGSSSGSVAWGDYDNDGRLDFLLTGYAGGFLVSQVWRNTGSGFSNVTASVAPGLLGRVSVAWGDYDNDGRLDFLITGTSNAVPPQLWRNTGGGFSNVTASVAPGLLGDTSISVAWGDYDNDGRLDFLLTASGQLWRNNMPVSNAPPAAPTGLSSTLSGATVSLSWNPPADDRTPSAGLNYNLRIGTTPGASDVLAPMALTDGLRLLPALGNAQAGTNAFVFNVAPGRDYYWSVQAVDTSFAGSPFAAEQQFTVAAPRIIELLMLGNGHFQFSFSNEASVIYAVLGTTNVALPLAQWTVLGPPVSLGGGLYRFTDLLATNHAQRFYLLRQQ